MQVQYYQFLVDDHTPKQKQAVSHLKILIVS